MGLYQFDKTSRRSCGLTLRISQEQISLFPIENHHSVCTYDTTVYTFDILRQYNYNNYISNVGDENSILYKIMYSASKHGIVSLGWQSIFSMPLPKVK